MTCLASWEDLTGNERKRLNFLTDMARQCRSSLKFLSPRVVAEYREAQSCPKTIPEKLGEEDLVGSKGLQLVKWVKWFVINQPNKDVIA